MQHICLSSNQHEKKFPQVNSLSFAKEPRKMSFVIVPPPFMFWQVLRRAATDGSDQNILVETAREKKICLWFRLDFPVARTVRDAMFSDSFKYTQGFSPFTV